jgi:hypothetical protein
MTFDPAQTRLLESRRFKNDEIARVFAVDPNEVTMTIASDATINRLPTVDEILSGDTQAGVPKPPALRAHEDDGTVQRVGSSPASMPVPEEATRPRWRTVLARVFPVLGLE